MPSVQVNLYAGLRSYIGGKTSVTVEITSGSTTLGDVLGELGIPSQSTRIFFINGRAAMLTSCLVEGDQVGIFPVIGGG